MLPHVASSGLPLPRDGGGFARSLLLSCSGLQAARAQPRALPACQAGAGRTEEPPPPPRFLRRRFLLPPRGCPGDVAQREGFRGSCARPPRSQGPLRERESTSRTARAPPDWGWLVGLPVSRFPACSLFGGFAREGGLRLCSGAAQESGGRGGEARGGARCLGGERKSPWRRRRQGKSWLNAQLARGGGWAANPNLSPLPRLWCGGLLRSRALGDDSFVAGEALRHLANPPPNHGERRARLEG